MLNTSDLGQRARAFPLFPRQTARRSRRASNASRKARKGGCGGWGVGGETGFGSLCEYPTTFLLGPCIFFWICHFCAADSDNEINRLSAWPLRSRHYPPRSSSCFRHANEQILSARPTSLLQPTHPHHQQNHNQHDQQEQNRHLQPRTHLSLPLLPLSLPH